MRNLPLFVILLALATPQSGLTPDQEKSIQKLVSLHNDWGPKMSTPGASVEILEDQREGKKGKKGKMRSESGFTVIHFLMKATGLPKDQTYQLAKVPFPTLQPQIIIDGIGIRADGVVVCPGEPGMCTSEESPDDPIDLVMPAAKGEVQHLVLISSNGKIRAMFAVTPFPARAEDKDCNLDVVRLMPMGAVFFAAAKGLPPNTEIEFKSVSEGEAQGGKVRTDAQGAYENALLPAVKGKDAGTVVVSVKSNACSLSTDLKWGKGSDQPE